eukprot:554148_1
MLQDVLLDLFHCIIVLEEDNACIRECTKCCSELTKSIPQIATLIPKICDHMSTWYLAQYDAKFKHKTIHYVELISELYNCDLISHASIYDNIMIIFEKSSKKIRDICTEILYHLFKRCGKKLYKESKDRMDIIFDICQTSFVTTFYKDTECVVCSNLVTSPPYKPLQIPCKDYTHIICGECVNNPAFSDTNRKCSICGTCYCLPELKSPIPFVDQINAMRGKWMDAISLCDDSKNDVLKDVEKKNLISERLHPKIKPLLAAQISLMNKINEVSDLVKQHSMNDSNNDNNNDNESQEEKDCEIDNEIQTDIVTSQIKEKYNELKIEMDETGNYMFDRYYSLKQKYNYLENDLDYLNNVHRNKIEKIEEECGRKINLYEQQNTSLQEKHNDLKQTYENQLLSLYEKYNNSEIIRGKLELQYDENKKLIEGLNKQQMELKSSLQQFENKHMKLEQQYNNIN